MKAGRDHRIPPAKRSKTILAEMKEIRTSDFVFPGGVQERPLSTMAFLMLLQREPARMARFGAVLDQR